MRERERECVREMAHEQQGCLGDGVECERERERESECVREKDDSQAAGLAWKL